MSIAAPLLSSGSKPSRAIGLAAVSGLPTIAGALLGYSVGAMDPALLGAALSFAAGAMLYVVFGELLPEAEELWHTRFGSLTTMLGLLLGLALIFSHHHRKQAGGQIVLPPAFAAACHLLSENRYASSIQPSRAPSMASAPSTRTWWVQRLGYASVLMAILGEST